ncbi:1-pyrroline-5-carboxylate dehydrogenase 1 [Anaerohalosphaera lusitana]|uniref:L-glutamate gamma-semialdehyde dehydrogenase n=1 Tax=Anaerohalosphaera lusitana TaxID=1936003 RepID=A0A1U9NI28_9BACT|nr:L-glutamate gamma-semialdehyde dehydrogenase [Anaerohalosphaera lusitana]AQT67427.1 1-pyrroline-5-carboxylate dehydrogenase 1 [Anaerohalosphaera lusitana]
MQNTSSNVPKPANEPVLSYAPGTPERDLLKEELNRLESEVIEIPLIIGGKEIKTGNTGKCIQPHDHQKVLATFHKASEAEVELAIEASLKAKDQWEALPYQQRANIFLKAAELLSKKYRYTLNAATMLNQGKNAYQAEIDSACELIDFLRFNAYYMQQMYKIQPDHCPTGILNSIEYRPLEGFIFAVTPFNFTAIGGNLPTSPAMMGNTVLWKPASTAVYSAYFFMKILQEAGVPDGVINFIPGSGREVGDPVLRSPDFAGIHFTGSTPVFQNMWKTIGNNIASYKSYPRIVGETGGKDFMVVHNSADIDAAAAAIVRGAYEYQGQKCSALSRMYVPKSIWPELKEKVFTHVKSIKMGPPQDFSNFFNAMIDKAAFDTCKGFIDRANEAKDAEVIIGGKCDDSVGYFIEPTIIETDNPQYESMVEEIFAPVLTVFPYDDADFEKTLELCNQTSMYGLTGCIFAQDRYAVQKAHDVLRHSAGNFYINDKPTGAVVGQQPFGGGRGSGTNDKAGSMFNLMRWISVRTVKENYNPPIDYRYPFMG